jgi:hypothetical protein
MDDVNSRLRLKALKMKGNAVLHVRYDRGIGLFHWKLLTGRGLVVVVDCDEKECPFCAETVKRKAIVCRYCGRDLPSG